MIVSNPVPVTIDRDERHADYGVGYKGLLSIDRGGLRNKVDDSSPNAMKVDENVVVLAHEGSQMQCGRQIK